MNIRTAFRAVLDLMLPRVCVVCGRKLLLREEHICTECEAELPLTRFSQRRENPMSEAFNAMIQRDIEQHEPYSNAAALIFYSGTSPYRGIPQGLKYRRNFAEGRHFARRLGRELAASPLFSDVDLIVPVPLHWARKWRRGYNQAEVIAKGISEGYTNHPAVNPKLLKRLRRTKTQTKLHRTQRLANVKSAFIVNKVAFRYPPDNPCHPRQCKRGDPLGWGRAERDGFRGIPESVRHLLLVDDVFTTGATLCACHRALRSALGSSVRISIATLAVVEQ